MNQYKTATITTINLLNNNYNPINTTTLNNRALANDNSINATNTNITNSGSNTSTNFLNRKRSQKLDSDDPLERPQHQHYAHHQQQVVAQPPGISLHSLNEESAEQIKPNRLSDPNKPLKLNFNGTARDSDRELASKKTADDAKETAENANNKEQQAFSKPESPVQTR